MIEVNHVTKQFGKFTAIDDLSFQVKESSIYGLVGYNGAGKTTLLKVISGVYKAEKGHVKIDGQNVFDNAKTKQKIFYVPDDIFFLSNATMETMAKFYKDFYPKFNQHTFEKLTAVFGLDKKKRLNGFSKGMQRQAEIVLSLAAYPDILLLDESFDGLDPAKRNLTKNLIIEYSRDKGCSVLISSHNLHELEDMCDHVGLINGKKLTLDCSVDEMSSSRCKFRLVFNEEKARSDFEKLKITRFVRDGRIIVLTAVGDYLEIERQLQMMSPLLLEKYPLTLEEIFLDEMEDQNYDLSKIFD